jgi:hypothetical protein
VTREARRRLAACAASVLAVWATEAAGRVRVSGIETPGEARDLEMLGSRAFLAGADGGLRVLYCGGRRKDLNGDGFVDLLVRVPAKEIGLASTAAEACLRGRLDVGTRFAGCVPLAGPP